MLLPLLPPRRMLPPLPAAATAVSAAAEPFPCPVDAPAAFPSEVM